MDGVYAPLAYDCAPLLRVPVCVSRTLRVKYGMQNVYLLMLCILIDLNIQV